jgi:hypothetical protein
MNEAETVAEGPLRRRSSESGAEENVEGAGERRH